MRVFIVGIDGYLGWTLACHLANHGHVIAGTDCGHRRKWVRQVGGTSGIPIADLDTRVKEHRKVWPNAELKVWKTNIVVYDALEKMLAEFEPDAIVHLGEQPSAPFSMIDIKRAAQTQYNNVIGSLNLLWAMRDVCPDAHLVKLGTMGEYGTPDVPIPEGKFPHGSKWVVGDRHAGTDVTMGDISGMTFPRDAGSFYHQSKVHDTHNTIFACKIWGLTATDIMQGVVYGTSVPEFVHRNLWTRFDFDECFGTVINRFCAQAVVGHPLTVYGKGGQTRGYLPLVDSMQCMRIAIENPPAKGEYRPWNQFDQAHTVNHLANVVAEQCRMVDIDAPLVQHLDNPRTEKEQHVYETSADTLLRLGYKPHNNLEGVVRQMLLDLKPARTLLNAHLGAIAPKVTWKPQPKYCI